MNNFKILKALNLVVRPLRALIIKHVLWIPSSFDWIKWNYADAYQHNSLPIGCGGIFRDHLGNFVLAFANKVLSPSSYLAEFAAVLNAMKITVDKGWSKFWLEMNFVIVMKAFSNPSRVPWHFKNQWFSCLAFFTHMNFFIYHIHRERNYCADFLENIGLSCSSLTIFEPIPSTLGRTLSKIG